MLQRYVVPILLVGLALGACGRESPPGTPMPDTTEDEARTRPGDMTDRERDAARLAEEEEERRREAVARAREILLEPIYFGYDQFAITSDAESIMRQKASILRASPEVRMRIEGHADERGSLEYNLALGLRRAAATRDYLVAFGLPAGRFDLVSYGEERPAVLGTTEEAYARNRRAEFGITAGGNAIMPPGQ